MTHAPGARCASSPSACLSTECPAGARNRCACASSPSACLSTECPAGARMVWAYPQTPSEAQRVKVSEPLALPDALGQLLHADEDGVQTQRRSERAPDAGRVVGLHEQALQKGPRPQTELSGQGLEHRIITGVDERDRTRAAGPAGLFRGLRIQRSEIERQLQVRGHRLAQT